MAYQWSNRIVGHSEADPATLVANDKNFRRHPKRQRLALAGGIHEVGFLRSVTVNRATGRIIDGHLRVELALRQKQKAIPVEWVELTEAEEAQALATLDPIAGMAETDEGTLAELLQGVNTSCPELQAMFDALAPAAEEEAAPLALEGAYEHPVAGRFVVIDKTVKVSVTGDECDRLTAALLAHRKLHQSESGFFAHLLARAGL